MNSKAYREQGIDLKRLTLVLAGKLWIPMAAIVCGAVFGGLIYQVVTRLTNGETQYRVSADYYITFNFDEFEHGDDYYNAYTWDGHLKADPIVDYALTMLPQDITKDMLRQSVSGEMLGDYRVLTVHVTTDSKERSELIADAYEQSLIQFGQEIELLEKIERWSKSEAAIVEKNTKTANAALLGAVLLGTGALLSILYYYLLEDAFYTEKDVRQRLGLPVFGIKTRNEDRNEEERLKNNLASLRGEKNRDKQVKPEEDIRHNRECGTKEEYITWRAEQIPGKEDWELLQGRTVVLLLPWGKNMGRAAERLLEEMKLHSCEVVGSVLVDAEDRFLKMYYHT